MNFRWNPHYKFAAIMFTCHWVGYGLTSTLHIFYNISNNLSYTFIILDIYPWVTLPGRFIIIDIIVKGLFRWQ